MKILDEIFDNEFWKKLSGWVERPINASDKADRYDKLFRSYGLRPLDMGTNRIVYTHKKYPKVVFKVALDEQGLLDSLNEYEKSDKSKYFPQSFDIDRNGYVLVQERVPVIDLDVFRRKDTQKRIRSILRELDKEGFVLVDLGSDKHKNYGMAKNGDIYIIDFGYVEYKSLANFNCPHTRVSNSGKKKYCKGELEYNKTFTFLQCSECENVFKVDIVLDGYTETLYQDNPQIRNFLPSDELYDFYRNFSKGRDRSTLTKYVELSNPKTNIDNEEGDEMPSTKNLFLRKVRGESDEDDGQTLGVVRFKDNFPEDDDDDDESPSRTVVSRYRVEEDINIIEKHDDINEERVQTPSRGKSSPTVEEILRDMERASENNDNVGEDDDNSKALIKLAKAGLTKEELTNLLPDILLQKQGIPMVETTSSTIIYREPEDTTQGNTVNPTGTDTCADAGIIVNLPTGVGYEGEIHLVMVAEELKKRPVLVISKNDCVFYIDVLEHIDRLVTLIEREFGDEIVDDMIITAMVAEPLSTFDKDYDSKYAIREDDEPLHQIVVDDSIDSDTNDGDCSDDDEDYSLSRSSVEGDHQEEYDDDEEDEDLEDEFEDEDNKY